MTDHPTPPRIRPERQRIRCTFDKNDPRPILGDLLKQVRAGRLRSFVGQEIGISGNVVRDIESHFGCKKEEMLLVCEWLGVSHSNVQLPTAIKSRAYGRPRTDTPIDKDVANAILDHLRQGLPLTRFESVKYSISSKRARELVARWMHRDPDFKIRYEQARAIGAHFLADQCVDIADDSSIHPNQARNQIQARQWLAGQLNQNRFGKNPVQDVTVNIGFGEALEALERRRQEKSLPAPTLEVIDVISEKVKSD